MQLRTHARAVSTGPRTSALPSAALCLQTGCLPLGPLHRGVATRQTQQRPCVRTVQPGVWQALSPPTW